MSGVSQIDDLMSARISPNWPLVFNLANSIIGVAVLALPFCFKEVCRLSRHHIFKPPPPVGAGGGYMFSVRPSVRPCVRLCVRASVIHVVVLCFRDIFSIC